MSKRAYFTLYMLAVMVAIMGFYVLGPRLETFFYPPYTKFKILSIKPIDALRSLIVFEFDKQRICDPRGLAWFDGEVGRSRHVDFTVTEAREAPLGLGHHVSRPYLIEIPAGRVATALSGDIYSQCHGWWTTVSHVYP